MILPAMKNFRGFLADAVHSHEPILGRAEDGLRIPTERLQQPTNPHRTYFW